MSNSPAGLQRRITHLKADLVEQGRRVQALVEAGIEAVFTRDTVAAGRVVEMDEVVDRVDIDIEKAAVQILTDACGEGAAMEAADLRLLLTIVKVNNELERIADVGCSIAEQVPGLERVGTPLPPTFRVLCNSVIGILRDAVGSLDRLDPEMARVVLLSEEAAHEFKRALVRDSQEQLARGRMNIDLALGLGEVATLSVVIIDHCTNIAEQIIYVGSGTIVRHMQGKWEEVKPRA